MKLRMVWFSTAALLLLGMFRDSSATVCTAKWSGCTLGLLCFFEETNSGLSCYESSETNRLRGNDADDGTKLNTLYVANYSLECGDQWNVEKDAEGVLHAVAGTKLDNACGGTKIMDTGSNPCTPPTD